MHEFSSSALAAGVVSPKAKIVVRHKIRIWRLRTSQLSADTKAVPSEAVSDSPCRDAPWHVRARCEVMADENMSRMADAPRRVPTGNSGHAAFRSWGTHPGANMMSGGKGLCSGDWRWPFAKPFVQKIRVLCLQNEEKIVTLQQKSMNWPRKQLGCTEEAVPS